MASNAEKTTDTKKDAELEDLLDSALEDFDRQQPLADSKPSADTKDAAEGQSTPTAEEPDNLDDVWSADAVKEAMLQFEKTVKTMCSSFEGDSGELELLSEQVSEDLCKLVRENISKFDSPKEQTDLDEAIKETLKNLADNSRDLQEGAGNADMLELMDMLKNRLDLGQEDGEIPGDITAYFSKMMQMLLSKEFMYQPVKELCEKYPGWLEENKSKLSEEQLSKNTSQLEVMKKVCAEYENMSETDSEDVKSQKFISVIQLMQKMQDYGYPPEELLTGTINISNEMISGFLPGGAGVPPAACSIM